MVVSRKTEKADARLRFVALGSSIVSDWENPVATSARAVLNAIAKSGHEVTFLEQRGNPFLAALLANRGSRAYKGFVERFPNIQLRTYDLPRGWQRTVWFGSEIGTSDAVIALPGTPPELVAEISALTSLRIVRLIDESFDAAGHHFRLVRSGENTRPEEIVFGPAIEHMHIEGRHRPSSTLLVAYDDRELALTTASRFSDPDQVELVVTGSADLPEWIYVPEIELPDWYGRYQAAVVIGAGDSAWSMSRRLLPRGYGCASSEEPRIMPPMPFPSYAEAAVQADGIVAAVRRQLQR
jgi:hypothetical protein